MSSVTSRQSELRTTSAIARSAAAGKTAPLGLPGLLISTARVRGDNERGSFRHPHNVRRTDPVRSEDDHLVSRIEQRLEEVVDRVLGSGGGQHLLGPIFEAVFRLELLANRCS